MEVIYSICFASKYDFVKSTFEVLILRHVQPPPLILAYPTRDKICSDGFWVYIIYYESRFITSVTKKSWW